MIVGIYLVDHPTFYAGRNYLQGQLVEFQDPPADDTFRKLCSLQVSRSGQRWEGYPIEAVSDLKALLSRDRLPTDLRLIVKDRLHQALRRQIDSCELEDRELAVGEIRRAGGRARQLQELGPEERRNLTLVIAKSDQGIQKMGKVKRHVAHNQEAGFVLEDRPGEDSS